LPCRRSPLVAGARGSERSVRIVLTFEEAAPGIAEPEERVPTRVLFVTGAARSRSFERAPWWPTSRWSARRS